MGKIRQLLDTSDTYKHKGRVYCQAVCAFDIEVFSDPVTRQGKMYVWQFCCEEEVVIGRTWDEYISFIHAIESEDRTAVVYVHNLGYEFQFLSGIFDFQEVFSLKSRKPIRALAHGIEYRCSYRVSGVSLEKTAERFNKKYFKLSGDEFDYNVARDSSTPLNERELAYCAADVLAVVEFIHCIMDRDGDTLKTIPMTATGYVRREAKHALRFRRRQLSGLCPDSDLYVALREAFRGGNTHANRYKAGKIIEHVKSADRGSSYPDVLCNELYPCSPFRKVDAGAYQRYFDGGAACVLRAAITGIRCKWSTTVPYMSRSKCRRVFECSEDNGRVLDAEYLETTLTDIDLQIVLQQYDIQKLEVLDLWVSAYDRLPQELIDLNIEYYQKKTQLKNVEGQELFYLKAKEQLNAIFGMTAQDPIRPQVIYDGEWSEEKQDIESGLEAYRKKGFLPYQWGVWTTALARKALQWGIDAAGMGFVYADTDSVKYTGDVDWKPFNKDRIARSKSSGTIATDPKGVIHYMGVYEQEDEADEFITLGAKRYAYTTGRDLHLTVAGVNKKKGAEDLLDAGGLRAFREDFEFKKGGRLLVVYNDTYPKNIYMEPAIYTVSLSKEYKHLLEFLGGLS